MAPTDRMVETAARTLLASGYTITGVERSPRFIEIACERTDNLGARCPCLLVATEEDRFSADEIDTLRHTAARASRAIVLVGQASTDDQLSWADFLEALGGAVPAWRALADFYADWLLVASRNQLPSGQTGEAWRLFEDLVADGLGFLLGRRVLPLGARKRGQAVSDMITQTPHGDLVVVDAKAAANGFDASKEELRPLIEYTRRQIQRQRGNETVIAALLLSSAFPQTDEALNSVSRWFLGEARVPLCLITADLLASLVDHLKDTPGLRNAIRWHQLLTGGRLSADALNQELRSASDERYPGRRP